MTNAAYSEGIWPCVVLSATTGQNDKDEIVVRVNIKFDDGPDKGKAATYEDAVNTKSSLYIGRSLTKIGWAGQSLKTLSADVEKWIASTGGKSSAEVKHIPTKKGGIWAKVNSLGRGPKPLTAPAKTALEDADAAMRQALADDGSAPPMDSVPPGEPDDSIPFVTSHWTRVNGGVL